MLEGMTLEDYESEGLAKKNIFPPTIILNPDLDSKLMQEEVFGPILPVIEIDNLDAAIEFVNARPKPLACYYFGKCCSGKKVINKISSGGMVINDVLIHVVNGDLPFGGVGNSGYGKYHGKIGFQHMSNAKAVLVKYPSNFYPFNSFDLPFTPHRQQLINIFSKYCQFSQKQFFKGILGVIVLFWVFKGLKNGSLKKKWHRSKPILDLMYFMIKAKLM